MKNGYIKENPMRSVTLNIRDTKVDKQKIVSREDFDRALEEIVVVGGTAPNHSYNQFNYQAYAIALQIGWYTGLRVSEVFGLKKEDFDFNNYTINIQRRLEYHNLKKDELYTVEKMKTDASKAIIPMAYPLKDILQEWFTINPYEWVVVDIEGKHIHPAAFNARVRSIAIKLGIEYFHFHCLRHTGTMSIFRTD
ncbi:tyrosine-type recombinase/integrase [Thomasclavelia sp.]